MFCPLKLALLDYPARLDHKSFRKKCVVIFKAATLNFYGWKYDACCLAGIRVFDCIIIRVLSTRTKQAQSDFPRSFHHMGSRRQCFMILESMFCSFHGLKSGAMGSTALGWIRVCSVYKERAFTPYLLSLLESSGLLQCIDAIKMLFYDI